MDPEKRKSAWQIAAREPPEIGWRGGERAQGSVGQFVCRTPGSFENHFWITSRPEPSRWIFPLQEILRADKPGGDRIGRLHDSVEDGKDLCDLGMWAAVGAELERRVELAPSGTAECQQAASLREIADRLPTLYVEKGLGLLDVQQGAEHLPPGSLCHGQQGGSPSQGFRIFELRSILGKGELLQGFLEGFGGGMGSRHGMSVVRQERQVKSVKLLVPPPANRYRSDPSKETPL
ncbi:MAG: hypothetical protein ABI163_17870 [Thermoanaerobaculia bacterium]